MLDTLRSTGASEIKFLVDPATADQIRVWARQHLSADPYGGGPHGDTYTTTTLYLDTPELDVFYRRGSNGRAKYRVRRYENKVIFVERKLRTSSRLAKRRTHIDASALSRLATAAKAAEWDGTWFHRRITARRLAPTCQVRYTRMARMLTTATGTARLTVDTTLLGDVASAFQFGGSPSTPFLENQAIVEMKFRQALPAAFKSLIEQMHLTLATVSKYRNAMVAIGAVVPEAPGDSATEESSPAPAMSAAHRR